MRKEERVSLHSVRQILRLLRCLTNSHLVDFVDGERLCCTFTVRYQQLQTAVAVKVCGYSSCRCITVMMQLNTPGSSLQNIYYPHAGRHSVSTVIELIVWNKSVLFYKACEETPVELCCHLMVRCCNDTCLLSALPHSPVPRPSGSDASPTFNSSI